MTLQNLSYTINNLSPRQKIAALAGIVGASAVIGTVALSQRQPNPTTVKTLSPNPSLPNASSPLAPSVTLPNTTGNLDATLTPGTGNSSSGTTTSRFNNGTVPSSGSNLNLSSPAPGSNLVGRDSAANSNLNSASPSITAASSPSLTITPPGRVFVPDTPSTNFAPASPIVPTATTPTQNLPVPSADLTPIDPVTPQTSVSATSPTDSPLPSSAQSSPAFDSRTGTYTASPRLPNGNSGEISNSPNSTVSPRVPNSNFGGVLAVSIGLCLIPAIVQIFILIQVLVVLVELIGTQTPATRFMVALMELLVATQFITIPMETSTLIRFMAILMAATLPTPHHNALSQ